MLNVPSKNNFLHRSVNIGSMDTVEVQKQFKVAHDADTLLIFNENHSRPIVSLSMSDIPVNTMQDVISRNKYLVLPRLSSQVCFILSVWCVLSIKIVFYFSNFLL